MTIKAEIATVRIGPIEIEGLMNEDGDFGVAVPQFADVLETSRNTASRDIKRFLGKDSKASSKEVIFQKWKTPFNKNLVNVILLDDVQFLIREYDKAGHPVASKLIDALFGLSLHQLFADAFGIKFEKEDRQRWVESRLATKHDFRPLTDELQRHGFSEPSEYAHYIWAFQTKLGIESGTRDELDYRTLCNLQRAQVRLTTYMECGIAPWDALDKLQASHLLNA